MKVEKISLTKGLKLSYNFQSFEIRLSVEAQLDESDDKDEALKELDVFINKKLKEQIEKAYKLLAKLAPPPT